MPVSQPALGTQASASQTVTQSDLASSLTIPPTPPSTTPDTFSPVFATARMISLMEVAASRVLAPHQAPDEMSVGVVVNVRHSAPTPAGAKVTAYAKLTAREGKLYVFDVWAEDAAGEIGRGVHSRAFVSAERLEAGAKRRGAKI